MVKTPRTRHSKSQREPVTIDLDSDSVKRVSEKEQAKPQAAAGDTPTGAKTAEKQQGGAETKTAGTAADKKTGTGGQADAGKETAASVKDGAGEKTSSSADKKTNDKKGDMAGKKPVEEASPPRRASASLAAGIAGGVAALILAGGLQWAGVLPSPAPPGDDNTAAVANLNQEIAALKQEIAALKEAPTGGGDDALSQGVADNANRVEALAGEVDAARNEIARLQSAVASGDAGDGAAVQTLTDRLSALEEQVAELVSSSPAGIDGGASDAQLAAVEQAARAAGEAADAAASSAEANAQRLGSLEQRVNELGQRVEASAEQPKMALVIAASALRSAIDRGDPFAGELETFAALAPDSKAVDALEPYAESGVPTRAELARRASEAASRIVAAVQKPEAEGSFLDQLMASARSLVVVRPVGGDVEGDGPDAVAARMEAAVQEGDYDAALSEYDALPQDAKAAASGFADQLRARQTADRIVNDVLADALKPA